MNHIAVKSSKLCVAFCMLCPVFGHKSVTVLFSWEGQELIFCCSVGCSTLLHFLYALLILVFNINMVYHF
jgi:hypothetical protein